MLLHIIIIGNITKHEWDVMLEEDWQRGNRKRGNEWGLIEKSRERGNQSNVRDRKKGRLKEKG